MAEDDKFLGAFGNVNMLDLRIVHCKIIFAVANGVPDEAKYFLDICAQAYTMWQMRHSYYPPISYVVD